MFQISSNTGGWSPAIAILVALALISALAAGCGGSDSGTASGGDSGATGGGPLGKIESSSLSKVEYIERAEEICAGGNEDILGPILTYMRTHAKPHQSEEEAAADAVHAFLVPKLQTQIDELSALGAPAGDEEEIENFLVAMVRGTEALEIRKKLSLGPDVDHDLQDAHEQAFAYGVLNCPN